MLSGVPWYESLNAFAIDRNGNAVAIGYSDMTVYSLDLVSLQATSLGQLQLGVGQFTGGWSDLAFDAQGVLWGIWGNALPSRGTYTIDLQALKATYQFTAGWTSEGLAFGPETAETPYCSAKVNSLGCMPVLQSTGLASPTASSGYEVSASNVANNTMGRLLYSVVGPASTPFAGGTLCLASPTKGTSIVSSGGSPKPVKDCSGNWVYDLNSHWSANPGPGPGDTIYCQWFGRDRGFAPPDNYALTSALEFTLLP